MPLPITAIAYESGSWDSALFFTREGSCTETHAHVVLLLEPTEWQVEWESLLVFHLLGMPGGIAMGITGILDLQLALWNSRPTTREGSDFRVARDVKTSLEPLL